MRSRWAATLLVCAAVLAAPLAAEVRHDTPTVNFFKPKRVLPPAPGTKRFLTIQINPEEQARELAAAASRPFAPVTRMPGAEIITPGGVMPQGAPSSYGWYWTTVSPTLGDRAGRFQKALEALSSGPGGQSVRAPRLAHLQDIADRHGRDILAATIGTEVSPALVLAVISTESGGRPDAVSRSGAVGLMQLIPATATRFDVDDSTDPGKNIRGGVAYLDWLMKEFDRDPLMVIAAYNAGENAVKRAGGVPPYAETRDYVPKVLAAWQVARGLCLSPPELVTDGCVFALKG
ncbi:soluble lytic murein transglycosylase-like protein [Rhodobacter sp. 140A]|uniref:Lytic transglycosylase domain-containing protein n=3 Tax=root TaxID=1 RepID=A0A3S3N6D8_9RHOB|nr:MULTISPECIES: lytic transglycosylase domain-containing protein [Sinirhodobacter]RBP92854.1 soluble lytic murein transglycosylase-like protein [Rhodobacter sp. 140A]RWR44445.1 lytic transglycosylase domain-containing protein [Sinirhodobacter ferrireducens]RWR47045.1 lytic transglycosylase domain-containing protein [Sinirhodobacter huangdaonensis]